MTAYDQSDLVKDLDRIFPEFASYWEKENEDEDYPSSTLHSVYMSFLPFLLDAQPTQKQWRHLAEHLSEAVAAGGDRENAVDAAIKGSEYLITWGDRPVIFGVRADTPGVQGNARKKFCGAMVYALLCLAPLGARADNSDCLYNVAGITAPAYMHNNAFKRAVWDDTKKRATILTKDNGKIVVQYSACAEFGVDVDYEYVVNNSDPDLHRIRERLVWLSGLVFDKKVRGLVRSYLDSPAGKKDVKNVLITGKTMLDLSGRDAYTELSIYVDFHPNSRVAIGITAVN